MKLWNVLVLIIVVVILGWGIFNLVSEKQNLSQEVQELEETMGRLDEEGKILTSQIQYFKNPENLLKEVKSRFNYRESGEGLIIVVPEN